MTGSFGSDYLTILSRLVLCAPASHDSMFGDGAETSGEPRAGTNPILFPERNPEAFLALANSHHVVVRALQVFSRLPQVLRRPRILEWATDHLNEERARIEKALSFLQTICTTLEEKGCPAVVIKSLDHWPDLGSDLDLFSPAKPADILRVMTGEFKAVVAPRSWGDRLANKWNFIVPGLPELVEVHVGRLGQTGEQVAIAKRLRAHAIPLRLDSYTFVVPAAEDRIMISAMQRMYRHFYLRLCDVIDNAQLLESGAVNYSALKQAAQSAGLWKGVAAYLVVISDYVAKYRGRGVHLPEIVTRAASLGGSEVEFRRGFLRIPIAFHAMGFYAAELATLARGGELKSTLRLSLLPCLATAAAVEQKITGSDKGIW